MTKAIAVLVAVGLAAFGVARGTWAVGGSDSSCYGMMAAAFASGALQPSSALTGEAPWPNASTTTAPGGFIPSPVRPAAASPICAPGFALLMAPFAVLGGRDAIFWVTPIAGAVLVMSAFAIARGLAGGAAGVTVALLTATSPIVLFQVVQPMNDVATAALWMLAFAVVLVPERTARVAPLAIAGVVTGLAILVRPNLAPLAVMVAACARLRGATISGLAVMVAAAVPGVAIMAWLQSALYGSVLASGYGPVAGLFAVGHAAENARNYGRAIFDTHNVIPAIGLLAPVVFAGEKRKAAWLLLAAAAVVTAVYLFYTPFPEWWYLRFLMPALVILLILSSAVAVETASRARMGGVIPLLAVLLAINGTRAAGARDVFALQGLEGRYRETAAVVSDRLPANAVLVTVWQSGSIRFHAGREIVMWDSLDPQWLDRAVAWLHERGHRPYLLFERREEREFRERFRGASSLGALDWPPRIDIGRQARIYDPADRARYLAGEKYSTENIGSSPR